MNRKVSDDEKERKKQKREHIKDNEGTCREMMHLDSGLSTDKVT